MFNLAESRFGLKLDNILEVLEESGWTEIKDIYRTTSLTRNGLKFILYILEREGFIKYKKNVEKIKIKEKGLKYLELPKRPLKINKGGENIDQREKQE